MGLGLVLLVEHSLAKIDPLIKLIKAVVFPLLGGNTYNLSTNPNLFYIPMLAILPLAESIVG